MLSDESSSELLEVKRILCATQYALICCRVVWNLNVNSQSTILCFLDTAGHEQGSSAPVGLYIQKCGSIREMNILCSFLFLMEALPEMEVFAGVCLLLVLLLLPYVRLCWVDL